MQSGKTIKYVWPFVILLLLSACHQGDKKSIPQDAVVHEPKADKPDEFFKLYNDLRTRYGRKTPDYPAGYQQKALIGARAYQASTRTMASYSFVERGPGNVPGRTRGLVIDPDDITHLTYFAGGVGGGIWKTTDGGNSWVNKTPDAPNLAISCIVMAESDHDILYAGTGEGWGGSSGFIKGNGIYKSTDHGETWSLLSSTAFNENFQIVNRLVVDPANPDIILSANSNDALFAKSFNSGIYKSYDGGATWQLKFPNPSSWVQQIVATPGDFNTLYATVRGDGVYKSTDAGETWFRSSNGLSASERIEMAVSPVNTDRLFASVLGGQSGTGADLFISDDAGASWELTTDQTGVDVDFLGGQGWYDNTVLAHPFDENTVYIGGVSIWRFDVQTGRRTDTKFADVVEQDTRPFMSLVDFSADYYGGRLEIGDTTAENFVSVEVRFGPDGQGGMLKQMAHRFTVPDGRGSGVAAADYSYQDYVEVPFQVWDVDNNRQLMVAFRDQQKDGVFNLLGQNTDNADWANNSREYIYISSIPYDSINPATSMAMPGGHESHNLYFFWPVLTSGIWDATNLPTSNLIIYHNRLVERRLVSGIAAVDAYGDYNGNNGFGQNIGSINQIGVHPDHHNLQAVIWDGNTSSFQLLSANDGGIYKSNVSTRPGETEGSWEMAGISYNTAQFYAVAKAPGESRYIGGMQDNGTYMSRPGEEGNASAFYRRANYGDGFGCAWNYTRPEELLSTVYFNAISKTVNGGSSWAASTSGLLDVGSLNAPFISELENLPSEPDVVFTAGARGVWRSDDFGDNWQLAEISNAWTLASTMPVRISEANSNIIWAGQAMIEDTVSSLHVSTDAGTSFDQTNNYTRVTLGRISGLATHPMLDSTAFALFSFAKGPKILRTNNLGQSWYDISGFGTDSVSSNGFPDVAVYDLQVLPNDTSTIWAGTEIGLFESTDAGANWHYLNANMPAASIWQMNIVDDQIVMATHGRGIWSVTIPDLPGQVYIPRVTGGSSSRANELIVNLSTQSSFDSLHIYINDSLIKRYLQPTNPGPVSILTDFSQNGQLKALVKSFYQGLPYTSHATMISMPSYDSVVDSYENDFETPTSDFEGNGFRIKRFGVFPGIAIHSNHPYEANAFYQFVLRKPIRISASNSLMNYFEVGLVEPGEEGSTPGSAGFNDYIAVQGSLDGVNWLDLTAPYDAEKNTSWMDAYSTNADGDKNLLRLHAIDLQDSFAVGDEILIRFVLHSNSSNESWGWTIDNLRIQTGLEITALEPAATLPNSLIYPNPVQKDFMTIEQDGHNDFTRVTLINIRGAAVFQQQLIPGRNNIFIPSHIKDGVYFAVLTGKKVRKSSKIVIRRNQ